MVALRLRGEKAPAECVQIVFNELGQSRRVAAASAREAEMAYCFHPGPYCVDIVPFAAAPEMGLRISFVIDAADPRVAQQRFDLYLFSEVQETLTLAELAAAVEAAVQDALRQGTVELPPCTSLDEWHAFRAGLNQLLYTRFGITVDDCIPVDVGDQVDYAAQLRARSGATASVPAAMTAENAARTSYRAASDAETNANADANAEANCVAAANANANANANAHAHADAHANAQPVQDRAALPGRQPSASELPAVDAHALRRLFLELPVLSSGLRLAALPPGPTVFLAHRSLLQRIALIALDVNTMPALAWAAPGQPLAHDQQQRRARHSALAAQALDQAWALLARLQIATGHALHPAPAQAAAGEPALEALLDEADRLLANLDYHLNQRRLVRVEETAS